MLVVDENDVNNGDSFYFVYKHYKDNSYSTAIKYESLNITGKYNYADNTLHMYYCNAVEDVRYALWIQYDSIIDIASFNGGNYIEENNFKTYSKSKRNAYEIVDWHEITKERLKENYASSGWEPGPNAKAVILNLLDIFQNVTLEKLGFYNLEDESVEAENKEGYYKYYEYN